MSIIFRVLILVFVTLSGCESWRPEGILRVSVSFQKATESSIYQVPILHLENPSSVEMFVIYPVGGYRAVVDTLGNTIKLDFVVRKIPELFEYDFPTPLILELAPKSKIRLHCDPILSENVWDQIVSGNDVYATVGYLEDEEFFGIRSFKLKDRIVKHQKVVTSSRYIVGSR